MKSIILGVFASLLSAATAWVVSYSSNDYISPLWLLLGQYIVGIILSPPKLKPVAPFTLHGIRLAAGIWAFAGYYIALATPGASAADASMLLNTAPIFATFYAVKQNRARLSAILAFVGVALTIISEHKGGLHFAIWQFLALTSALAYAASFIILGLLADRGEKPKTTSSVYNLLSVLVIIILIAIYRPSLPIHWWPVIVVGGIAALRIQVLTIAVTSPEASAKVSILTNLAFVWLAIAEVIQGTHYTLLQWVSMALVILGVGISPGSNAAQKDKIRNRTRRSQRTDGQH